MRNTLFLIILMQSLSLALAAQEDMHRFNFGMKSGFGSTIYSIQELSIAGHTINDIDTRSEVSWQGAFFLRLNMNRHYLQTECSLCNSRYTIQFPTYVWYEYARQSDISTISTRMQCIEVPLLYGIHLRQEGDYGMSLFVGPKLCYILSDRSQHTFTNFTHQSITEVVHPFSTAAVFGFGINIHRLFFDFAAEAGLTQISKQFNTVNQNGAVKTSDIIYDRRKNSVNFSIGFMF